MAYALDGQWAAMFHGLPGVFRNDRVKMVLDTVKRYNVAATQYGAINFVRADGTVLESGEFPMRGPYAPYDFFSPELFMLAMNYMYEGQVDFGLELARRCMHDMTCEQGLTWDQPNIIRGDTGERMYGNDYPQNLIIWSIPAAMQGKDLTSLLDSGGLVYRVLKAAKQQ